MDSLLITLPFITSVINASLLASIPEVWKTAEITPIPKQGNHELPYNNRPISLLPALSKVCERVAYNQFVTYLTTKERPTRLTTSASTSALKWFKSYLTNRYQVVRIHSSVSDPLPVECGVPQGSILGPLLFSIYVNDLPEVPRHCSTECYVDDTKLFVSFNLHDSQRIVQEMNEDLLQVGNWCFRNRLLLNPDKTKLIVFGSRQMTSKLHEFHLSL